METIPSQSKLSNLTLFKHNFQTHALSNIPYRFRTFNMNIAIQNYINQIVSKLKDFYYANTFIYFPNFPHYKTDFTKVTFANSN